MASTSVRYAATVTLRPQLYKYKPEEQYDRSYMEVAKMIKALDTRVDIIAELTKSFNLHYHLTIEFINFKPKSNLMLIFHNAFRNNKIFGFVNIRQIDNDIKWLEYIKKDLTITKNTINRPPVILNEISDLGYTQFLGYEQLDLIEEQ